MSVELNQFDMKKAYNDLKAGAKIKCAAEIRSTFPQLIELAFILPPSICRLLERIDDILLHLQATFPLDE